MTEKPAIITEPRATSMLPQSPVRTVCKERTSNARGVDPRRTADRLGHSQASFTIDKYVHTDLRGQERVAAIANGLLTKTPERRWDHEQL